MRSTAAAPTLTARRQAQGRTTATALRTSRRCWKVRRRAQGPGRFPHTPGAPAVCCPRRACACGARPTRRAGADPARPALRCARRPTELGIDIGAILRSVKAILLHQMRSPALESLDFGGALVLLLALGGLHLLVRAPRLALAAVPAPGAGPSAQLQAASVRSSAPWCCRTRNPLAAPPTHTQTRPNHAPPFTPSPTPPLPSWGASTLA